MAIVGGQGLKKLRTETRDRLSELPKNLIEHILESMPIQDAVRTSALASNWRYNWTTISKLAFDKSFWRYLVENGIKKVESIRSVITQVMLLLGNNPIQSFDLYRPNTEWGDSSNWMLILARKGVKKLTLAGGKIGGIRKKLPSHIFSCLELTHLLIGGCHFNIPSNFRGFPNLISLELDIVAVDYESFGCFITNCPLLERMTLKCLKSILGNLNIHSPSLKHLYISGIFESIWIDAKLLKTMSVNPCTPMSADPQTGLGSMFKALGMLPEIENLSLGCEAVEFLPAVGAPMALPTPLTFLKKLELSVNFSKAAQICSALCLIRSAPSLMELEITATDDADEEPVSCYLGDDIMLSCLKVVKFWLIYYLKPEMEMIQSLLASSPYLEKMFVEAFPGNDEKVAKKITSDLLRFVRLSPKAEIIYTETCEAHLFEHLR